MSAGRIIRHKETPVNTFFGAFLPSGVRNCPGGIEGGEQGLRSTAQHPVCAFPVSRSKKVREITHLPHEWPSVPLIPTIATGTCYNDTVRKRGDKTHWNWKQALHGSAAAATRRPRTGGHSPSAGTAAPPWASSATASAAWAGKGGQRLPRMVSARNS